MHANGTFDANLQPQTLSVADATRHRLSIEKHFYGALEATSAGEMLSGGNPKSGSAGYVALETVTGTLDSKNGSFQLMHWGTMHGGSQDLRIEVVPDSGTGTLAGITGTMKIEIATGGKHTYFLEYLLPAPK